MSCILGVGTACVDYLYVVPELNAALPRVIAQDHRQEGGGVMATAAVAAARLGAQVSVWTRVGDDPAGRQVLEGLRAEGIDTSTVLVLSGASTQSSAILVHAATGERHIAAFPGQFPEVSPDTLPLATMAHYDCLLVDGRWVAGARAAAQAARQVGVPVVADLDEAPPDVWELATLADYLFVPQYFAASHFGPDRAVFQSPTGLTLFSTPAQQGRDGDV
ncbi:MAG: hypothetical protein HY335_07660 [Deinococcus sp.]|nr:hypothetical protein [Deinococcus sp.]